MSPRHLMSRIAAAVFTVLLAVGSIEAGPEDCPIEEYLASRPSRVSGVIVQVSNRLERERRIEFDVRATGDRAAVDLSFVFRGEPLRLLAEVRKGEVLNLCQVQSVSILPYRKRSILRRLEVDPVELLDLVAPQLRGAVGWSAGDAAWLAPPRQKRRSPGAGRGDDFDLCRDEYRFGSGCRLERMTVCPSLPSEHTLVVAADRDIAGVWLPAEVGLEAGSGEDRVAIEYSTVAEEPGPSFREEKFPDHRGICAAAD